mgnify:CR=1 FL=1
MAGAAQASPLNEKVKEPSPLFNLADSEPAAPGKAELDSHGRQISPPLDAGPLTQKRFDNKQMSEEWSMKQWRALHDLYRR